tara:strand:- start:53 stop:229 length:177 start_codon:yes stop_codon:yes gene_type:complete
MLEKTISDNTALGIKQAEVKLTLPVIEITCYQAVETNINTEIKQRLLDVIGKMLDKQL